MQILMHSKSTTYLGLLFVLGLLVGGCVSEADETTPSTGATGAEPAPDVLNTLTSSERDDGWQLLFNGKDLGAWRGVTEEQVVPEGWAAQNGAIVFSGDGPGDLMTRQTYRDFELQVDWRISEGGNSGLFYRVPEGVSVVSNAAPEYQLIDAEHFDGALEDYQMTGANYALHPPAEDAAKPAGEWNETRILVRGDHVEHWLNGVQLVEYELGSADWRQRLAKSKFADDPEYAQSDAGHIVLQNHGDPVWFRNVKVRPL